MFMLRKVFHSYIEIIPPTSPSFLIALVKYPGLEVVAHITLYLPTHGRNFEFITVMAELRNAIDDLLVQHNPLVLYIRGDSNCNPKNKQRFKLLNRLLSDYDLKMVEIKHPTYHHFVGDGLFDSCIDVLVHSSRKYVSEEIVQIKCKHTYPLILSHHDIIISKFTSPSSLPVDKMIRDCGGSAPKIQRSRVKIHWKHEGILKYEKHVSPYLSQVRRNWYDPNSPAHLSILLSLTNDLLNISAEKTNKSTVIGPPSSSKRKSIPRPIKRATNKLKRIYKRFFFDKTRMKAAKKVYRSEIRAFKNKTDVQRDQYLAEIFSNNPAKFYRHMKNQRRSKVEQVEKLSVGNKVYVGQAVCDGFYASMSSLKSCNFEGLLDDPNLGDQLVIYEHILKLCEEDRTLPPISLKDSQEILLKIKKNVMDHFGITALHYIHAGKEGLFHFNFLLNAIIQDVSNASLQELNTVHGLILHKGHNKDKSSHRSYRTISTCPFLAKCLDLYLRRLYHQIWDSAQAVTQFQGTGSNHELASLLVTEVVQHSLYVTRLPVYVLALDAQSAFDRCLPQILSSYLYRIGIPRAAVNFLNNRFRNRKTVYEWDGILMGPASDDIGVEQGGINSSDFYKIYNNSQLEDAQESGCGVDMESCVVAAIGQADDVLLVSNDIFELQLLCHLTETYCKRHNVNLEPGKTKLVPFSCGKNDIVVKHAECINSVNIDGVLIPFSEKLEHVGVVRDRNGNMAHILNRISQHKKALASVLFSGAGKSHRGNPAASLRIHTLYCTPVLLSGVASLVLTRTELNILDSHYTKTLLRLQRLYDKTPRAFIHLLGGSLPFMALLSLRRMSLFHMICMKPSSPLYLHAKYILTFEPKGSRSWFIIIKETCQLYGLDHPLSLLANPPTRLQFKKLVKLKVCEYWQHHFKEECLRLPSLKYFDATRASLLAPHATWKLSGSSPFEVNKSLVVAKMLSGRYRSEAMKRHWSNDSNGFCSMPTCGNVLGDLEHLLLFCPALEPTRSRLYSIWSQKLHQIPLLNGLFQSLNSLPAHVVVAFLLNPSANSEVVRLSQLHGSWVLENVMYLTRTFVYNIHKEKLIQTGDWTNDTQN